ncbi:MAG TPA: hypothetical protein VMM58_07960 [Bacteroidota bacterium]|nr:hypothetical protein [Bacteroidota bacterium]
MKYFATAIACLLFLWNGSAQSQPRHGDRSQWPAYDRIESYKKVRMLEALKLGEDQSVKFVSRYDRHQATMRQFEKDRNQLIDKLDSLSQTDVSDADYDQIFSSLLDIDKKVADERRIFLFQLKDVLSQKQIAQYIVFERNFVQELRQAMRDVQRERMRDH